MAENKLIKQYAEILIFGIISVFMGVLVGIIDTIFGKVLIAITSFRELYALFLIPFLPVAGAVIIFLYERFNRESMRGMSLVFEAGNNQRDNIPVMLIPLVTVSTWLTHLFGGSVGREGVAVQIGASVGNFLGRRIPIENSSKILLVAGMAAGFGGLFQTPAAAVFFSLEVLSAGALEHRALLPALAASYTACYTSRFLGLEKFFVDLNVDLAFNGYIMIKLLIIGIIFGIVGGTFAHLLDKTKKCFTEFFVSPVKKIIFIGIVISLFSLIFHTGRYSGLGTNLISESFNGGEIYWYDFLMKFVFTIVTIAAGFQGGEVTPLFSMGAGLGIVLSSLTGLPAAFSAALGYACMFGSATNTLIAPMFIGAEIFGYDYMPYFIVVCAISYIFNGDKSIYSLQRKN